MRIALVVAAALLAACNNKPAEKAKTEPAKPAAQAPAPTPPPRPTPDAEKARGAAYADKAVAEGAKKFDSGLVYKDLTEGKGASPAATSTVKVHYKGTLVDGTEFDSSYKRGTPAEFPLNGVIPCWTEGLQKMKPGGKAQLICPSSIAYGDFGRPSIPGGATLVFEVELLEVK